MLSTAFELIRAVIDACQPYEWINKFARAVEISDELADTVGKGGNICSNRELVTTPLDCTG
jgi:hypothetical protein